MTKEDVLKAIQVVIPGDRADRAQLADLALQQALARMTEDQATDWNEEKVEFTIPSGSRTRVIGTDILNNVETIMRVGDLHYGTAHPGRRPVEVLDKETFYRRFAGETRSGAPIACCMYRADSNADLTLEVFPVPDQTYTFNTFVKRYISNFDEIPPYARATIADMASQYVAGLLGRATTGVGDSAESRIGRLSSTGYDGGRIRYETQFTADNQTGVRRPRSWDLTSER